MIFVFHQRKLRWLGEETQEGVVREHRQRRQLQEAQDQFNTLQKSWDAEKTSLQRRLDQQERMLSSFSMEKKGDLEVYVPESDIFAYMREAPN